MKDPKRSLEMAEKHYNTCSRTIPCISSQLLTNYGYQLPCDRPAMIITGDSNEDIEVLIRMTSSAQLLPVIAFPGSIMSSR